MLVIASLFPELGDFADLSKSVHLTPKIKPSDSIGIKIAKLGLAMEQHLMTAVSDTALLLWSRYDLTKADAIISGLNRSHRDQIIFPTCDIQQSVGWAAGHSVALTRWAAVCKEVDHMDFMPWPHHINQRDVTANLVWWAQRINLRVYEFTI